MTKNITLKKFEKLLKTSSFHYDVGTDKIKLNRIFNKLDDLRSNATIETRKRIDEISDEIEYFLRLKEREYED